MREEKIETTVALLVPSNENLLAIGKIGKELEVELGLQEGPIWNDHQTNEVILYTKRSDFKYDGGHKKYKTIQTAIRKQAGIKLRIMLEEEESVSGLFLKEHDI